MKMEKDREVGLQRLRAFLDKTDPSLHVTLDYNIFSALVDILGARGSVENHHLAMQNLCQLLHAFQKQIEALISDHISPEMIKMLLSQLRSDDAACSKLAADSLVAITKLSKKRDVVEKHDIAEALMSLKHLKLEPSTLESICQVVANVYDFPSDTASGILGTRKPIHSMLLRIYQFSRESLSDLILRNEIDLLRLIREVLYGNGDVKEMTIACTVLAECIEKSTNRKMIWDELKRNGVAWWLQETLCHKDKPLVARVLECLGLLSGSSFPSQLLLESSCYRNFRTLLKPSSGVCKEALHAVRHIIADERCRKENESKILFIFQHVIELVSCTEASQMLRLEAFRACARFLQHDDEPWRKKLAALPGFPGALSYWVRTARIPEVKVTGLVMLSNYVASAVREGKLQALRHYWNNHPEDHAVIQEAEDFGKNLLIVSGNIKRLLHMDKEA